MPTFEEIVKDDKTFPDDVRWQLADGLVLTLGDIRSKIKAYDQGYTQKYQEVAKQRQAIQQQQQELAQAYQVFQQQVADFQKQQQATPAPAAHSPATGDVWSEPGEYFKPLVDWRNSLDQRTQAWENQMRQQYELIRDAITWVADRETQKEYEAARSKYKDYWDDELSKDTLTKYAHENKIVDKRGFPLVSDAAERYLSPKIKEHEMKEAEKRGYDKARKETPAATAYPRPGFAGQNGAERNQKSYGGDLGAFFRDMRQDGDVNNAISTMFGYNG